MPLSRATASRASAANTSGCSTTPCGCSPSGLTFPIHTYTHGTGFSISGGYVYRGCDIPSLRGHYFFADFATARIWSVSPPFGARAMLAT